MRQILAFFILTGLLSCKGKVEQTNLSLNKTEDQFRDLKKSKEIKFGGGDVWGTTSIFTNADSTMTKVLVDYDAGDYGNGRNEYLIVNGRLIYQRDSIVDWVINKSSLDSSKYKLRETICYFNADSTGTMTTKAVYSMTMYFTSEKIQELKSKKPDSLVLASKDYLKLMSELKTALTSSLTEN